MSVTVVGSVMVLGIVVFHIHSSPSFGIFSCSSFHGSVGLLLIFNQVSLLNGCGNEYARFPMISIFSSAVSVCGIGCCCAILKSAD